MCAQGFSRHVSRPWHVPGFLMSSVYSGVLERPDFPEKPSSAFPPRFSVLRWFYALKVILPQVAVICLKPLQCF